MDKANNVITPGQMRYLRACMVCSIVQTASVRLGFIEKEKEPCGNRWKKWEELGRGRREMHFTDTFLKKQRFRDQGCPNCEEFLRLQGNQENIESCTSQVFEGVITLADPARSWVAKWQRLVSSLSLSLSLSP